MKKNLLLTVLTILTIIAVCGYAYAKWSFKTEQSDSNVFGSSCLSTSIEESDEINLQNVFPISDEDGMKLTPYTFTLTNDCDVDELVNINIELFNNTLSASQVDYSFNGSAPKKVITLTSATPLLDGASSAYSFETDSLAAGESKTYSLKLWVDKDETITTATGKTFDSKISITTSYGK